MTFTQNQITELQRLVDYRTAGGAGATCIDERSANTLFRVFAQEPLARDVTIDGGLLTALKGDALTVLLKLLVSSASTSDCTGCRNLVGVIDPNGEVIPEFAGQTYNQTNTGQIWVNIGGGVDDEWTELAIYPIE